MRLLRASLTASVIAFFAVAGFAPVVGCHWAGWKIGSRCIDQPSDPTCSTYGSGSVGGVLGGVACAEWAYQRDKSSSDAKPEAPVCVAIADAGELEHHHKWLPMGWCEPPPGQERLIPCDGGSP